LYDIVVGDPPFSILVHFASSMLRGSGLGLKPIDATSPDHPATRDGKSHEGGFHES
jgi:hypothetical protein